MRRTNQAGAGGAGERGGCCCRVISVASIQGLPFRVGIQGTAQIRPRFSNSATLTCHIRMKGMAEGAWLLCSASFRAKASTVRGL